MEKNFVILSFVLVLCCFAPLFYFSTKFVLNGWAYSDGLINYSEGFVRRGFLGEVIINIHKFTNLKISLIHAYIFIFFTCLNIFLYILILKNISKINFLYLFLLFNPLLLFFPLNDTGGYLRKEIIMVTLMLFHCYQCNKFHKGKINLKKYLLILNIIIIPSIIINTLIHDMQLFLIPFHFLLTLNIVNNDFNILGRSSYVNKKNLVLFPYILTILPFLIFISYPTSIDLAQLIAKNILEIDPDIFTAPITHTADPFIDASVNNTKFMFSADKAGSYDHLYNYFILLTISIGSIYLIFNKILKDNIKIYNHYFILLSIFPIFLLFFIGRDWGRWINIISWTTLLFYFQFNIKKTKVYYNLFKSKTLNIFLIIICCFFLFFITLPHCCKQQTIFGGFSDNINLVYKIIFNKSKHIQDTFRGS